MKKIEKKLREQKDKNIILNSFIILTSWSDLWKENQNNIQEKMEENNVYRIDWTLENSPEWKSYLDLMFKKMWIFWNK